MKTKAVYIDAAAVDRVVFEVATFNHMYYRTLPPTRAILRVDDGNDIETVCGCVVDVSIGWDAGTPGFVHPAFENMRHTKITIRRILAPDTPYDHQLSDILQDAPQGLQSRG